ncbi:restriction endonuclease [Paenibacillus sp. IITD108]|uniref:restriction endonuclease n=1 Tax=Paenibacillus sp. IITD108 TaxID=3116649 RepID=UPI002F42A0DF
MGRTTKRGIMKTAFYSSLILSCMLTAYFYMKTITIPLAIGVLAIVIYLIATTNRKKQREERVADSGIHDIDQMDTKQFELFLLHLFKGHGYAVEIKKPGKCNGIELLITKGMEQTIVFAKNDKRHLGIQAVQQVVELKALSNASSAWLVTNRDFSSAAYALADSKQVRLINRDSLMDMVIALKLNHQEQSAGSANHDSLLKRR